MAGNDVVVYIEPRSAQVLSDLYRAAELVDELAQDLPWRDEPRRIIRRIRRAVRALDVRRREQ